MRGTQGALIVASTLQIVFGFSCLWRNIVRLIFHSIKAMVLKSSLSAIPLVAFSCFGLYELGVGISSGECIWSN
ncbi:hypothetical protein PIB30_091353 [Stylosanthes scabra]|uniref:Uncharacterized protein n=1 Tax=Stylosanthes scabra TaxID=79078 RepID=A0ABU6RUS6_9FABA|nr:hypothetical protein [Stylosanthes scabra]